MNASFALEWSGCLCGLAGALLLALHCPISRWGWWLFLVANLLMIGLALEVNLSGLLVQQLGFSMTSIIGLRRAGFLSQMKG